MVSNEPREGRCNATAGPNRDGYCESYPVTDDDGDPITGRCRMHNGYGKGGAPEGNQNAKGAGAPEGNKNALTHGATARPMNLERHLDPEARQWVNELVSGYLRIAPFGYDDPRRERLTRVCVMIYQEWAAADTVMGEGPSETQPVGVRDNGRVVSRKEEHHLAARERALNQRIRANLKDLGVWGSSASDSDTVASIFAAAVERAKERELEDDDPEPETIPATSSSSSSGAEGTGAGD